MTPDRTFTNFDCLKQKQKLWVNFRVFFFCSETDPWNCLFKLLYVCCRRGFPGGASDKELTCQCRRRKKTRVRSLAQKHSLEDGRANHSSIIAWRIPWTQEPDGLQSVGSQRAGRDWSDLAQHSTWCRRSSKRRLTVYGRESRLRFRISDSDGLDTFPGLELGQRFSRRPLDPWGAWTQKAQKLLLSLLFAMVTENKSLFWEL